MKITIKFKHHIKDSSLYPYLTIDKWYEGHSTPSFYLIKCDDGRLRKFLPGLFITKEEHRDSQLKKIL